MTYPGLGGQQPPPQNSAPAGQLVPGVTPGVTGQVVATRVVIIGSGGELLVYSPSVAAGNLIASIAGAATTDSAGNSILAGISSYAMVAAGEWVATNLDNGALGISTATSEAGPWSLQASIGWDFSTGNMELSGFLEVLDTSTFEAASQFSAGITVGNGVTGNSIQMNPARVAPGTSSGTTLAVTQSHLDQLVGELQAYGLLA